MSCIWMSIVSSRSSGPEAVLCQLDGTRPRLAKSSRTRGMTPGSARACTEKHATLQIAATWRDSRRDELDAVAQAAGDDMAGKLQDDGGTANGNSPILRQDRVANSPVAATEEGCSHDGDAL